MTRCTQAHASRARATAGVVAARDALRARRRTAARGSGSLRTHRHPGSLRSLRGRDRAHREPGERHGHRDRSRHPGALQRVPFLARGASGPAQFRLDGERVGSAHGGLLWSPKAGAHKLVLEDTVGGVIDQVFFTVR